ncbi:MAG: primase-helicase zinc-binding domain-containing protein [Chlamydiota bacterium]
MDLMNLLQDYGFSPKKKAACHGGEYSLPCPFCRDGKDRFLVWPQQVNKNGEYQGGRYFCRICQKYGDAITFLRELYGLSYSDSCAQLKLTPKKRQSNTILKQPNQPPFVADPPALWMDKAAKFIEWCHSRLMSYPSALPYVQARGFTVDSIIRYKIGFNPGDIQGFDFRKDRQDWGLEPELKEDGTFRKLWLPVGFTIPTFSSDGQVVKIKIRRTSWKEGDKLPKYVEFSGSKSCPSIYGDTQLPVGLVLESEFDGLLIQQEASSLVYCVALGGSTKSIDAHTDALLRSTKCILFLPDFDQAGALAWVKWKRQFPKIHRILTPKGKSAGDAFIEGINLREWIEGEIANSNKT